MSDCAQMVSSAGGGGGMLAISAWNWWYVRGALPPFRSIILKVYIGIKIGAAFPLTAFAYLDVRVLRCNC